MSHKIRKCHNPKKLNLKYLKLNKFQLKNKLLNKLLSKISSVKVRKSHKSSF